MSGTLADGQVVVDTKDEAEVLLVLNGVDISSSTSAPIYIADAEDAVIILANGAKNTVSDGNAYVLEADSDEPNAAIFSKADLTIEGNGALTVDGQLQRRHRQQGRPHHHRRCAHGRRGR